MSSPDTQLPGMWEIKAIRHQCVAFCYSGLSTLKWWLSILQENLSRHWARGVPCPPSGTLREGHAHSHSPGCTSAHAGCSAGAAPTHPLAHSLSTHWCFLTKPCSGEDLSWSCILLYPGHIVVILKTNANQIWNFLNVSIIELNFSLELHYDSLQKT